MRREVEVGWVAGSARVISATSSLSDISKILVITFLWRFSYRDNQTRLTNGLKYG